MVHSLARHWCPVTGSLTVVVIHRNGRRVVCDGTHRLLAAHLVGVRKWQKLKTTLTHVLVIEETP